MSDVELEEDIVCIRCRGLGKDCDFCFGLGFLQLTSKYEDELKEIEDGL